MFLWRAWRIRFIIHGEITYSLWSPSNDVIFLKTPKDVDGNILRLILVYREILWSFPHYMFYGLLTSYLSYSFYIFVVAFGKPSQFISLLLWEATRFIFHKCGLNELISFHWHGFRFFMIYSFYGIFFCLF